MKIVLIDPSSYLHNFGLRMIATQLEAAGHEVSIIFALGALSSDETTAQAFLGNLREHIQEADCVGLSVYTNFLLEAIRLTENIEKWKDIPVVWGGVHPTVMPEESLAYADYVCIGEGEDAIPALLESMEGKRPIDQVPNIWCKNGEAEILRNPILPLERDLDSYMFPMYTQLDRVLVAGYTEKTLRVLTEKRLKELIRYNGRYYGLPDDRPYYGYLTMTSRGCPYRCAYCINNAMNQIFERKSRIFRFRSIEHVILELEQVAEWFPFINLIHFFDDNLCARPLKDLEEFNQLYKERIGFPFKCNFHPNNVSDEKIDLLVDAGLVSVEMGIESGSRRTNREVYKRPHSNRQIIDVARLLAERHAGKVVPYFDVIMDNPYENHEDVSQTIRLILEIPRPFRVSHFSLTFFPGTELYRRALEDGIVQDLIRDVVQKKNNRLYADKDPYSKLLLSVSPFIDNAFLRKCIKVLAAPFFLRCFNSRIASPAIRLVVKSLIGLRGWYNRKKARIATAANHLPETAWEADTEGISGGQGDQVESEPKELVESKS